MSKLSNDYVCPVFPSNGKCDQDALRVMEQFKDFYEEKLNEVDVEGGGDCMELKLKIQRRWIEDLTEQTQMMARVVRELEEEATNRVRMLEDKLRQTSKSAYEVMKRYQTYSISHNLDEPFQKVFYLESDLKNVLEFLRRIRDDKKWSIEGLRFYDISYRDLFGKDGECDCDEKNQTGLNGLFNDKEEPVNQDSRKQDPDSVNQTHDQLVDLLKKKTDEYEELKRSMLDMRSALTEEVACKHDMISALKKDIQQLEERCVQADKQTAFKDDIIKELRKEIKQIKQQNKNREADLEKQLEEAKLSVKRMRPSVDMKVAWTEMDDELVIKKTKLIQNKDDIIQIQTDTLNVIEIELQAARRREKDLEDEINLRRREVDDLKCRCSELEKSLTNSQGRADNLQKAVDLYINSINVLEATEEKARIEIDQQKMTISNLQEALVNVKQELDELRQNSQQEIQKCQYLCNVFYVNLLDLEERNQNLSRELGRLSESYKKLQDCTFDLEVEHFNALQDLAILETRLYKYHFEYKESRSTREETKKLVKQIQYYEQVVDCFKHEMAVMSEQLVHLQEILNLSNQSCREESGQLHAAVFELKKLSEKLQSELVSTEKKVLIENQKNQLKDAKIDELQLIIGQKNADLNIHDEAINEMKAKLEATLLENHELQSTVVALNSTVMQLQVCLQNKEVEKSARRGYRSKGVACKRSVSECRGEDWERRNKYPDQFDSLKMVQREVERAKEKSREKIRNLKRQNEELKDKLATTELSNKRMLDQLSHLNEETLQISQKDCFREHELAQYKQIIIEMRQTLIELNDSLSEGDFESMNLMEEYHKNMSKGSRDHEDLYISCRCEIALYRKLADNLKEKLLKSKQKLEESEARNKTLAEEIKIRDSKIDEMENKSVEKENETCRCIEGLEEKLKESNSEVKRLSGFIENLKMEVQKKIEEKKEAQRLVVNYCQCTEMSTTQEEINSLKVEIKNMIQNQLALNSENDKLLKQVGCLQSSLASLEEKNRHLKQKVEKLHSDNQILKEKNKTLVREKENYVQTIQNLEMELMEAKNCRDDLCVESRHVVNNVKAWLEEQKKINNRVMKNTQCYCNTIARLKQENETLLLGRPAAASTPCRPRFEKNYKSCIPVECQNTWCVGSQGGSIESPRESPMSCTCSVEEWYSPTYRDDDETEENEFIDTIEAFTQEMRCTNRKWKANQCQQCQESVVSKDVK